MGSSPPKKNIFMLDAEPKNGTEEVLFDFYDYSYSIL